ncbi:protein F29A7.6 [Neocloeon triangulifer]|uniref:protein F29A7.6 n=1 Tax=Neocloeon triangulifer TaxID=2078957 RepID=UPI00286F7EBD|nr:protein F29A7.6 [Neocloeon triangulifer]
MGPVKKKKFQLPKSLLEMKFMKKTKELEEKRREDEDRKEMFSNEITDQMVSEGQRFLEEPSLVPLLNLREGRFSYLGFNKEIEQLMQSEEDAKKEAEQKRLDAVKQEREEKCVLDEDMALRMASLSKSIGLKFMSKRQRNDKDSTGNPSKKVKVEESSGP